MKFKLYNSFRKLLSYQGFTIDIPYLHFLYLLYFITKCHSKEINFLILQLEYIALDSQKGAASLCCYGVLPNSRPQGVTGLKGLKVTDFHCLSDY
jgi:hypothetical protein